MRWYYYLHTNGDLIGKNPIVVDGDASYFDSPFVKKYWLLEGTDRKNLYIFLIEAFAMGAKAERIQEIAKKNGVDEHDMFEFVSRVKPTGIMKDNLPKFIELVLDITEDDFWTDFELWAKERTAFPPDIKEKP